MTVDALGPLELPVAVACIFLSMYVLMRFVEEQETGGGLNVRPFKWPWEE